VKSFFTSKSVNDNNNIPSRTISFKEVVTKDGVAIGKGSVQDELDGGDEGKIYGERDTSLGSLNPKKRPLDALSKQPILNPSTNQLITETTLSSPQKKPKQIPFQLRVTTKVDDIFLPTIEMMKAFEFLHIAAYYGELFWKTQRHV
jgi:hypothetical protein